VLDLFEDTFQIYIVMEYLTGGHLLDLLTRLLSDNSQRLSEKDIGNIIYQVMLALNHMHQRGIVHRDLKLENIMTQ
jgi:serine/threonine protein kinase